MSADRGALRRAIERGEREGGSVEFKERLTRNIHLGDGRRESLAAQLRHRVLSGEGEATYVVGVTDDGGIAGISPESFSESMDVLSLLAAFDGAPEGAPVGAHEYRLRWAVQKPSPGSTA